MGLQPERWGQGVFRDDPPAIAALLGDPVPGPTPGLLKEFSLVRITDAGDVVSKARISGGPVVGGVTVDQGLFRCFGGDGNCSSTGTGTLETLVLKNGGVPDRVGREFCSFSHLAASNFGVAFRASTKTNCADGAESSRVGIFRLPFGGGAIETVALENEASNPFPDPGGTRYSDIVGSPAIEDNGDVAFRAQTSGLLSLDVLFFCGFGVCPAARATVAVQEGDLNPDGKEFTSFSSPALADDGTMAFRGCFSGGCGVYTLPPGGPLATVAKKGDAVPGEPATFAGFAPPAMSPDGKVTFKATIRETAPPQKTLRGIFLSE